MKVKKNHIDSLVQIFSRLPGLGTRSARRIVLYLLQDKETRLSSLISILQNASIYINECKICGNLDSSEICNICNDQNRNQSVVAIVETVSDLWALERGKIFKGVYHVLGSNLSAASGYTPEKLRLPELSLRIKENNISEIILATNATLDGQTTAFYITDYFKEHKIKISRLASGIPIGGELDYLDEGTLSAAINSRTPF